MKSGPPPSHASLVAGKLWLRLAPKLTADLAGLGPPYSSEKGLQDLCPLDPAPLKALSEVVVVPLAQPHASGVGSVG